MFGIVENNNGSKTVIWTDIFLESAPDTEKMISFSLKKLHLRFLFRKSFLPDLMIIFL